MGSWVVVTLALLTMLGVRKLFSKGQVVFFAAVTSVCKIFIYTYIPTYIPTYTDTHTHIHTYIRRYSLPWHKVLNAVVAEQSKAYIS